MIPKSNTSSGEKIPGAERKQIKYIVYVFNNTNIIWVEKKSSQEQVMIVIKLEMCFC